jgi:hypothetical protein
LAPVTADQVAIGLSWTRTQLELAIVLIMMPPDAVNELIALCPQEAGE